MTPSEYDNIIRFLSENRTAICIESKGELTEISSEFVKIDSKIRGQFVEIFSLVYPLETNFSHNLPVNVMTITKLDGHGEVKKLALAYAHKMGFDYVVFSPSQFTLVNILNCFINKDIAAVFSSPSDLGISARFLSWVQNKLFDWGSFEPTSSLLGLKLSSLYKIP